MALSGHFRCKNYATHVNAHLHKENGNAGCALARVGLAGADNADGGRDLSSWAAIKRGSTTCSELRAESS